MVHGKAHISSVMMISPFISSFWSNSTSPPSLPLSVPLPRERGHCAAVRSQTAAADHWRQKGLCVHVWHPPEAAAAHFPGPWLSHQSPRTGCLRGLLCHWFCRGQHEGDTCSITHSLTCELCYLLKSSMFTLNPGRKSSHHDTPSCTKMSKV